MSVMREMLERLTPEKKEEMRKRRESQVKSLTAEYQFGYFVGEYIVSRYLPTISIDSIHTNRVISVTSEEQRKFEEIESAWWEATNAKRDPKTGDTENSEKEWNELMAFRREMEVKYLPHELKCHFSPLNITNEKEFKEGLRFSLWDCDICHYSIEPEEITIEHDDDFYFTYIIFKLGSLKK